MTSWTIEVSPTANRDLADISKYYRITAPEQIARIASSGNLLCENPGTIPSPAKSPGYCFSF